MNLNTSARLNKTISALAPIDGVSVGTSGDSATCRIDFQAVATAPQRTAAQSALAAFDWSDAATDVWMDAQHPNRTTLRQQAAAAVAANNVYLAIASPSNAQAAAQVRALTQQMTAVIKRLAEVA